MKVIKCDYSNGFNKQCEDAVTEATNAVKAGKLIVYPTETVYGIGADIYNQSAVKNLYLTKKRPFDMPLSVAVSDFKMMEKVAILDANAEKLAKAFLPGPLTIIVKKQFDVPDIVTSSSQKVGIRIPDNRFAIELIKRTGPIITTSANIHSHPDSVSVNEAIQDFGSSVDVYVDTGACSLGQPSTIVWLCDGEIEIVRQGAITEKQIMEVLEC